MRDDLSRYMIFAFVLILSLSLVVSAQDDTTCPAMVSDALAAVASLCEGTGRNRACYGNFTLTIEAQEDVDNLVFGAPGDMVNVADIQSLTLSSLDETAGEWGISLMKLQANLPATLPGQNVTMLLFGDVEITNAVGDTSDDYTPMQAFYFRSGIGDAQCLEAPESGILIQTPEGQSRIAFRVDDVDIILGSTAFLQAVTGDALYVNLLEGQATVTAFDETQTVTAGMVVSVPIDTNLAASGPPGEPYAAQVIETLSSVVEILPKTVTPPTRAIETVTAGCTVTAGSNVNLRSGPGTVYARAGRLAANESMSPVGQAMGIDGYVWWHLADGKWVRSDIINTAGNCEGLPIVTDIPPTPTPAPVIGGTSGNSAAANIHLGSSDGGVCWGDTRITAGQPVLLSRVYCMEEWQSFADVQATFPGVTPTFSIDGGEPIPGWLDGLFCCNGDGFNCTLAKASWVAVVGSHTMTSYLGPHVWSCTFTVSG